MSDALERYAPSGGIGRHFWPFSVTAIAIAIVAGHGYQHLLDINPYVAFNVLLPFALGLVCGGVSIFVLRVGHVRNRGAAFVLASALPLVALIAAWFATAPHGRVHGSLPAARLVLGVGEAIVVSFVGFSFARGWWRRAVYDESSHRWARKSLLGRAYGPELISLRRTVGEQGIESLVTAGFRAHVESANDGEYRLWLHRGTEGNWLTLTWHGVLDGLRNKKVRRDVLVLRRVVVPESVLRWLEEKFGAR
ncbi:MAG: hypothetical protein H6832_12760 [Planctomycetes bacterium]|nr:hypothetical protein [Planctomycetota bacterium]MCB9919265.1 hypothetical protein [Planctomycetota bacterium]